MLYALIAALITQSALWIVYLERADRRRDDQVQHLCQRIQAPETAVAQHVIGDSVPVAHLPFDDDGAWLAYVGEQPLIGTDNLG